MISYSINIDLSQLQTLADNFSQFMGEAGLPNTANAFKSSARKVQKAWTEYLQGKTSLDGIENVDASRVNSEMLQSIKIVSHKDFNYSVISNSQAMHKLTERSDPVYYDMKQTHPYGKKSRVSKKGIPYLIIPFRWGTPNQNGTKRAHFNNVIPQKNYSTNVSGLKISQTTGLTHIQANAKGQPIDRQEYNWGNRLSEDQAWNDRSVGMVKMKDLSKSTYFTFRIISAKSPQGSWLYFRDGKDGIDIIAALQRTLEPTIRKNIEQGIKADENMYKN